jgi:NadR type nicotinamide-nucleotide adenylyltransferase
VSGVRRVTITGSESTGKTSLAERLASHFDTLWAREFSRQYALEKQTPLNASDVEPIALGQIRNEDDVLARAETLAILDTDLLSTVVYAKYYYGDCPEWIEQAARARLANLYLLCDIDVPWVPDAARDRPHARAELHAAFAAQLEEYGASYTLVRGDWTAREAIAIASVEALMAGR